MSTLSQVIDQLSALESRLKALSSPSRTYNSHLPHSHSINVLFWTVSIYESIIRKCCRLPPDQERAAGWTSEWIGVSSVG
jgi:hypothetical protein